MVFFRHLILIYLLILNVLNLNIDSLENFKDLKNLQSNAFNNQIKNIDFFFASYSIIDKNSIVELKSNNKNPFYASLNKNHEYLINLSNYNDNTLFVYKFFIDHVGQNLSARAPPVA